MSDIKTGLKKDEKRPVMSLPYSHADFYEERGLIEMRVKGEHVAWFNEFDLIELLIRVADDIYDIVRCAKYVYEKKEEKVTPP